MTTSTLPMNPADIIGALETSVAQHAADSGSGGTPILKFAAKIGEWSYGKDRMQVEEGSQWAIHPGSLQRGYVGWRPQGQSNAEGPLGEEMASLFGAPIVKDNLPPIDGQWHEQVGMTLVCISGEDNGTQVEFSSSTVGGKRGFQDLTNAMLQYYRVNPGTANVVPVVELEMDSYENAYGLTYNPVFKIVDWATAEGSVGADDPKKVEQDEPEPEPKPKPAKAAATPKRRRRRTAA